MASVQYSFNQPKDSGSRSSMYSGGYRPPQPPMMGLPPPMFDGPPPYMTGPPPNGYSHISNYYPSHGYLPHPPPFHPPEPYPPYASDYFPPPPMSDHSIAAYGSIHSLSPQQDAISDNQSEMNMSVVSEISGVSSKGSKKKEADVRSVESGYISNQKNNNKRKIAHSTKKKELPENPLEAERIIKRRERNRLATERSRARLLKRALRGDRIAEVFERVGGHLKDIVAEMERIHIANVVEQLRMVGVDTRRLVEMTKALNAEIQGFRDKDAEEEANQSS